MCVVIQKKTQQFPWKSTKTSQYALDFFRKAAVKTFDK